MAPDPMSGVLIGVKEINKVANMCELVRPTIR